MSRQYFFRIRPLAMYDLDLSTSLAVYVHYAYEPPRPRGQKEY